MIFGHSYTKKREPLLQVMCTIDEALTNLDDMDYVIDLLRKIGRTHTRFENYKPEIFWVRD